jgi:para-nitrobenzyl esterase
MIRKHCLDLAWFGTILASRFWAQARCGRPQNLLEMNDMQMSFLCKVAATIACGAAVSVMFAQTDPIVSVTGGKIQGRAVENGAVFKGVPFAAPPVGDLRWKPPMPVKAWTGVRDAHEYAAECIQPDSGWNHVAAMGAKEDCLYLNIWAPEFPSKSKKPVMLWLHGGGNMAGSAVGGGGIEPFFDGAGLASHGVVVVTISYRMGMLGFMAHPELSAESPHHVSGNYGLLDIMASLQWVKANIAKFGGDPANVTVFGQSAGAHDIAMMLVSPLANGLFAKAIEESGTAIGIGARGTPTLADAEKHGLEYAAAMNAPATGSLAYMRSLSAADVLKAMPPFGRASWGPITDGYVIPVNGTKAYASGQEHHVPLMLGNNAREQMLAGGQEALQKGINGMYDGDLAARAAAIYAKPSDYAPYGDAGAQFATDNFMRCPTVTAAEYHAAAGNTVWEYEFSHAFPDSKRGAPHSGELRYVFASFPAGPVSDSEKKVANDVEVYWTNFAKTGNPNGGGMPEWPKFDVKTRAYLEFTDADGPVKHENLRSDSCGVWQELLKEKAAM